MPVEGLQRVFSVYFWLPDDDTGHDSIISIREPALQVYISALLLSLHPTEIVVWGLV